MYISGEMNMIAITELRDQLGEAINKVAFTKERIIITRKNKKIAAIISLEDLQLLENIEDAHDLKLAKKALSRAQPHDFISLEKAKKIL
jgi:prevent-host-death family protein